MGKKVTIIIPTFKRSEYLSRAIKSILMQTYQNFEIIVVDDNDETSEYRKINEELMQQYKDNKNIIYLKHKNNKNGAAARNTGIKKATGDYITFLDDDDYFLPHRLENLVDCLEKNTSYSCAYTQAIVKTKNKIINITDSNLKGNLQLNLLKQQSFFGTGSNLFFRRDSIERVGLFDERFIRHQDMEYMIRFFKNDKVIGCNDCSVVKCNDNIINKPNFEKFLNVKKLFFKTFEDEINSYKKEVNEIYYYNYLELLDCTYNNKKNTKFVFDMLNKYGRVDLKLKLKFYIKSFLYGNKLINTIYFCLKPSVNKKIQKEIIIFENNIK